MAISDWSSDLCSSDLATAIFRALDNRAVGIVAIADPSKPTTPEALAALRADGIKVVMLTGDNRVTAEAIARRLGIDAVEADVLPDQKSAVVQRPREHGRTVALAGDGVNDAPARAATDLGLAIGSGPAFHHARSEGRRVGGEGVSKWTSRGVADDDII